MNSEIQYNIKDFGKVVFKGVFEDIPYVLPSATGPKGYLTFDEPFCEDYGFESSFLEVLILSILILMIFCR